MFPRKIYFIVLFGLAVGMGIFRVEFIEPNELLLDKREQDIETEINKAQKHLFLWQQTDSAESIIKDILLDNPKNCRAIWVLSQIYREKAKKANLNKEKMYLFNLAEKHIKRALKFCKQDIDIMLEAARINYYQGKEKKAKIFSNRVLNSISKSEDEVKNIAIGIEVIDDLTDERPEKWEILLILSKWSSFFEQQWIQELVRKIHFEYKATDLQIVAVREKVKQILLMQPDHWRALFMMGEIYMDESKVSKNENDRDLYRKTAGKWLLRAYQIEPFNTIGFAIFMNGYYEFAEQKINEILSEYPDNPDALRLLSQVYREKGLNAKEKVKKRNYYMLAKKQIERCLQLVSDKIEDYIESAHVYLLIGEDEEAKKLCERILEYVNKEEPYFIEPGHLEISIEVLTELLGRKVQLWQALLRTGNVVLEEERRRNNFYLEKIFLDSDKCIREQQRQCINREIEKTENCLLVQADHCSALRHMGILYLEKSKAVESVAKQKQCLALAQKWIEWSLKAERNYIPIRETAARIYVAQGSKEKLKNLVDETLKLEPHNEFFLELKQSMDLY